MATDTTLDGLCISTIRTLAMDGVQKANSGHPGTAMAMAPVMHTLWDRFLHFNPANPRWLNRDRFVLSCGHASILLYSTLHVNGFDLPLDDIMNFRQLHSKCPGHPEYTPDHSLTPGLRRPPGHSDRGWRPVLVWLSRAAGWGRTTIVPGMRSSRITLWRCAAMAA